MLLALLQLGNTHATLERLDSKVVLTCRDEQSGEHVSAEFSEVDGFNAIASLVFGAEDQPEEIILDAWEKMRDKGFKNFLP